MMTIPDNLKCMFHNGQYYTHYIQGNVNPLIKRLYLLTIIVSEDQLDSDNISMYEHQFQHWPEPDIKLIPLKQYDGKLYKTHKYSIDKFDEILFKDLPEKVKKAFRKFEPNMKIDQFEAIDFWLNIVQR